MSQPTSDEDGAYYMANREAIRALWDSMRPGAPLSDAIDEFRRREAEKERAVE